ncbi:hypothetical protein L1987_59947 [Smallanthus sonchifolius]|uniref:Uncharacterized protein n=1 Tax=Smallanthus sonchifolius TaxID=185202 RepID=A0ACB9D6R1_9ASTR|nr:hypothetical protein L1987_59947 [Smallanthus sonchifolius]
MDKKEPEECEEIFESFSQAEQQQPSSRNSTPSARTPTSDTRGVHQITTETSMAAAIAAIAKEIKELKMSAMKCERNYPNSNWRSGGNPPGFQNRQNQYGGDREVGQNSGSSVGEKRIEEMLANQTQLLAQLMKTDQETQYKLKEHDTLLRSQQSAFLDLQRIVGDIARQLTDRSGGSFSGSTETNPKAMLKAVTTRSGKGGESERTLTSDDDEPVDDEIEMEAPGGVHERRVPASIVPNSEKRRRVRGRRRPPMLILAVFHILLA